MTDQTTPEPTDPALRVALPYEIVEVVYTKDIDDPDTVEQGRTVVAAFADPALAEAVHGHLIPAHRNVRIMVTGVKPPAGFVPPDNETEANTMTDQTTTPDPIVATEGGRSITNSELLAALDVAHLVHHVVRTHTGAGTVVAAFPEPADALAWADMLRETNTTPDATYAVPGYDVSPEDLAPYLQQVRAAKGGEPA